MRIPADPWTKGSTITQAMFPACASSQFSSAAKAIPAAASASGEDGSQAPAGVGSRSTSKR
jgi:hypothetical protein